MDVTISVRAARRDGADPPLLYRLLRDETDRTDDDLL